VVTERRTFAIRCPSSTSAKLWARAIRLVAKKREVQCSANSIAPRHGDGTNEVHPEEPRPDHRWGATPT
jgi:hypothetical protein